MDMMTQPVVSFGLNLDLTDFERDDSLDSDDDSPVYCTEVYKRRRPNCYGIDSRRNHPVEQRDHGVVPLNCFEEISPMMVRFLFTPPPSKPDTIIDFPHNVITYINGGDFVGLSDLVNRHLHSRCDISVSYSAIKLNNRNFVQLFELLTEAHPDRIMSVYKSELVGNQVVATVYMKFTNCKPLYEAVARTIKDPQLKDYFPLSRTDILKRRMRTSHRPIEERQQLEALMESDDDIVFYGCAQMILTLDDYMDKVVDLQMLCELTSAHIANFNCF